MKFLHRKEDSPHCAQGRLQSHSLPGNAPPPPASKTEINYSTVQKRREAGKPFSSSFSFPCKSIVLSSVICFCLHPWFSKMPDSAVGTLHYRRQCLSPVPFSKRSFFYSFFEKNLFHGGQDRGRFAAGTREVFPVFSGDKYTQIHLHVILSERQTTCTLHWRLLEAFTYSCSLPCCLLTCTCRKAF